MLGMFNLNIISSTNLNPLKILLITHNKDKDW